MKQAEQASSFFGTGVDQIGSLEGVGGQNRRARSPPQVGE